MAEPVTTRDNDMRLVAVLSVLLHYFGSAKLARAVASDVLDALDSLDPPQEQE